VFDARPDITGNSASFEVKARLSQVKNLRRIETGATKGKKGNETETETLEVLALFAKVDDSAQSHLLRN
jgi:hypothetical protein